MSEPPRAKPAASDPPLPDSPAAGGTAPLETVRMTPEQRAEFDRRRRQRNLAILLVLAALVVLFFFISTARVLRG